MAPRKKKADKRASRGASRGHAPGAGKDGGARSGKPLATGRGKGGAGPGKPRRRAMAYAAFEREEPTPEYLRRLFEERGFSLGDEEKERFWRYYCLLRKRNAALDLTRIMGIEATVLKHFVDCALVGEMTPLAGPLLDIGSGAGFPGAVLALRRPELEVVLAESRGKRVRFLEELKDELGLDNVTIHPRSVREESDLATTTVITRALETLPATLRRVERMLPPGGRVVFMKGPQCGREVTEAQEGFRGVYKMVDDRRYCLPGTKQQRRLVVFERRGADGEEGD